jgi:hypothetical protein
MSDPASEKKIIVDEDWKSRVEAERAATKAKPEPAEPAPQTAETKPAPAAEKPSARDADPALPPPDLMYIASTMYMQALVALGLVTDPITRKVQVRPNQARHAIDTLEVLRTKTEGNRTAEETEAIDAMLHEMHMVYVAKANANS